MSGKVITNVLIFAGDGPSLVTGELRIDGERITAVTRGGVKADRSGTEVIDGRGMTLMPGLVEAHAHLTFPSAVDRIVKGGVPPPEQHQFIAIHNAKVLLDHGFTSAFSGGDRKSVV